MRFFRAPLIARLFYSGGQWKGKDKNAVYLTFDDGPNPNVTPWILDLLEKHQVKATFFLVGENILKNTALLNKIVASGHSIGNHTMKHEKGLKTPLHDYINTVNQTDSLISTNLFRPPYGSLTLKQFSELQKIGKKIVFWTWLSYDFDKTISSDKIIVKAKKIRGGDILVFHDSDKSFSNLSACLEKIIYELKRKNLSFKTL